MSLMAYHETNSADAAGEPRERMEYPWHASSPRDILKHLSTTEMGLSATEAARRLSRYGPNTFPSGATDTLVVIFLRQFRSPLIYVLVAAAFAVALMGSVVDAAVIFAVLLFNALIGTIQEGRAQNTLLALRRFTTTRATALRGEKEVILSASDLVPGDIMVLQSGEKIPADARLLSVTGLKIDEASLTGESVPVEKTADAISIATLPLAERRTMVYQGTYAVSGSARAIVVATGTETEFGRIAKTIQEIDTEIPLKKDIRTLSRLIIALVAVIGVGIFLLGTVQGMLLRDLIATIIALGVSIIPEGLPMVLTLVLATGVWRMSKQNALVKRLQAVEALGQTRVIAVDKTGTITLNEMTVERIIVGEKSFTVAGKGYEPQGGFFYNGAPVEPSLHKELLLAGRVAAFCANARVSYDEAEKIWRVSGDPTEAALLVFATKTGFNQEILRAESPPLFELPFDSAYRYHLMIHRVRRARFLTAVGAPESILPLCRSAWEGDAVHDFTPSLCARSEEVGVHLAREGFRVLACAIHRNAPAAVSPKKMPPLTLVGFFGMRDPLRSEVPEAMRKVREAHLRVIMLTGDHTETALAIAREAGIARRGEEALTGQDIDTMSERELAIRVGDTSVFARVTPEHKLAIIRAFKKRREIIAMTGDGVNDAPSLVAADLGVAMGRIGTEVAKEAADIVLLDDNFGSIVSAAEEGRSIYRTIKKVILYLFSTSLGEVGTIVGAMLIGLPLPLLPTQIIWLNFVTDGFLTAALAMEPKEKKLLLLPSRRSNHFFVDRLMALRMILMALVMSVGTLILFSSRLGGGVAKALTISLSALAVFQWWNAWNCRHERESIFSGRLRANRWLMGATMVVVLLQLLAVYHPALQRILHTVPLSLADWGIIIAAATSIFVVEEARKWLMRRGGAGTAS